MAELALVITGAAVVTLITYIAACIVDKRSSG